MNHCVKLSFYYNMLKKFVSCNIRLLRLGVKDKMKTDANYLYLKIFLHKNFKFMRNVDAKENTVGSVQCEMKLQWKHCISSSIATAVDQLRCILAIHFLSVTF